MSKYLRMLVREVLSEEIGRNFHTINTDPYSYSDFQDYEVDIMTTIDGSHTLSILYLGKKLSPIRKYASREEADLAARHMVDRHRLSN